LIGIMPRMKQRQDRIAADIADRFKVPETGGRSTDPTWTERRQLPLTPTTIERLEALTDVLYKRGGVNVAPMQLAALLLENALGLVG
jgi:hypothetical protein